MKLSVVILSRDNERTIARAVRSASFADEVLVLDSGSEDRTIPIAQECGARVKTQEWLGFGPQKQRAVDLARYDWVFVLDSDESITPELAREIRGVLEAPDANGYTVPRLNSFFGKTLRHGGLYPDRSLRLFDRNRGRFTPRKVHERVVVEGAVGDLKAPITHEAYERIDQFIAKQNRYALLGARPHRFKALASPLWTFVRMYVLQRGFLDGWEGYLVARLYAQYTFWKYIQTPEGEPAP